MFDAGLTVVFVVFVVVFVFDFVVGAVFAAGAAGFAAVVLLGAAEGFKDLI